MVEHHDEIKITDDLYGTVERIVFQNKENGYAVCTLRTRLAHIITITGNFSELQPGQQLSVSGEWKQHPKFGKQFAVSSYNIQLPTTQNGLKKYLGSGLIKGIGKVFAEKIVNHFGTKTLDIIDNNPEQLYAIPGIGKGRIEKIIHAWKDQKAVASIMVFLQGKGISTTYATKIFKKYGNESIAILKENPYRLSDDIWGIGFKLADTIAQNMGIDKTSPERIKAGIIFTLTNTINDGHLYIEIENAKQNTTEILEIDKEIIGSLLKHALYELHNKEKIKVITHEEKHYITLSRYYYSEKGVASRLETFNTYVSTLKCDTNDVYEQLRGSADSHIALNDDQQRGIMACLQNKVTIITGGPGTGKTTLIKQLLDVLDDNNIAYKLAAPTGRASKHMMEGTGRHATTLHRLLEFSVSSMSFVHNEKNALQLDMLIIDEASMIDIFLAHAIIKALPLNAHLVLIGDTDQLPAVGAGNFLRDMITSKKFPVIQLNHIFRQAQNSLIVMNAHRINMGEFPKSSLPDANRDFVFIKENNPENVVHHLEKIYSSLKNYGISKDNAQVLVPMNRGIVGTQTLNHQLQKILNPSQGAHVTNSGSIFKIHDRVMQIRNNYDKNVFNGDIGIIEQIDTEDQSIIVKFYNILIVTYELSELSELVHAYAITIHKSQGSEYDAVIIPLFTQHYILLQRNLIYTALTRAKKRCILIGQPKAIAMAINKKDKMKRITFLNQFLTTDVQCRQ